MPLYEYSCDNCSYTFDKMVMRTDSEVNCPICQGNVKKLMSTFSVGHSDQRPGNLPSELQPKMCTNC
jgi:putative FmdB family regulatory protein